jgi:hypothetical protein
MIPAETVGAAVFIETISQNGAAQTRTEGGVIRIKIKMKMKKRL